MFQECLLGQMPLWLRCLEIALYYKVNQSSGFPAKLLAAHSHTLLFQLALSHVSLHRDPAQAITISFFTLDGLFSSFKYDA